jgi:hypothetical protein
MEGMRGSLGKRRRQEDKRGPGEESKDGKQGHCQVKLEGYTHWWNEGVTGGRRLTIKSGRHLRQKKGEKMVLNVPKLLSTKVSWCPSNTSFPLILFCV